MIENHENDYLKLLEEAAASIDFKRANDEIHQDEVYDKVEPFYTHAFFR